MYKIILSNQAIKHIKDLPKDVKKRVREVLGILSEYPIPVKECDVKKLKGEMRTYRIRIGKYRIIYEIDRERKEIWILGISHRKKAYR